ncbi:MAG: TlpA disulfide reductase family protein [Bacteroidota bacterium]
MKNFLLLLFLYPCLLFAQSGNFSITGKLHIPNSNKLAYLIYTSAGKRTDDSCKIVNGSFAFNGNVSGYTTATLSIHKPLKPGEGYTDYLSIYLEPGQIAVTSQDSLLHAKVTGTPMNDEYQPLRQLNQSIDAKIASFQTKVRALTDPRAKQEFIANNTAEFSSYSSEKLENMKAFVKNHPKSMISIDLIRMIGGPVPDVTLIESLFEGLSAKPKESVKGKEIAAMVQKLKKTAIGSMAPEFSQPDTSGKIVSLKNYRGKFVLIDFWASWCVPCRAENPALVKAYDDYKDKNFTVLSVSLDKPADKNAWLAAIKKDNLHWTNVSDLQSFQNKAAVLYAINAIPQNFLVDPDGKIVAKNLRGEALHKKLGELIR